MSKKVQVDLSAVFDALETISMTDQFSRAFVNMETGQIVMLFEGDDFSDLEDENLEDDCIPAHYLSLPQKYELDEYDIMEKFCYLQKGKIQENLLDAIHGRGAFDRFKTAVHCHNIETKWYTFREECLKKIAIEFCTSNDLEYYSMT